MNWKRAHTIATRRRVLYRGASRRRKIRGGDRFSKKIATDVHTRMHEQRDMQKQPQVLQLDRLTERGKRNEGSEKERGGLDGKRIS